MDRNGLMRSLLSVFSGMLMFVRKLLEIVLCEMIMPFPVGAVVSVQSL